jgi:hypothetical protein
MPMKLSMRGGPLMQGPPLEIGRFKIMLQVQGAQGRQRSIV